MNNVDYLEFNNTKLFIINATGEAVDTTMYFKRQKRKEKIKRIYERSDKLV